MKIINCTAYPIKVCSHDFPEVGSRMCILAMQSTEKTSVLTLEPTITLSAVIIKNYVVRIDPLPETDDYLIVSRLYASACHLSGLDTSRLLCAVYGGNGGTTIYPVVF